jgi:hypothetical protein
VLNSLITPSKRRESGRSDVRATHLRAQPSAGRDGAHASRYAGWNGFLKHNRPLHHADNGGYAERSLRQTSSQAAEALRPIAGRCAFTIFALGIIGTGLLAVPVLAGSAANAVGEALKWRVGLAQRPGRARAFYGAIALATLVGAILNFTPLDSH